VADIVQFIPKAKLDRDALIQAARFNYESIFPSAPVADLVMDHADNGMPSDSPYCAPDIDPA